MTARPNMTSFVNPTSCAQLLLDPSHPDIDNVFFFLYLNSDQTRRLESELLYIFLFVATAAGVVPCGIPKKRPRTSSIVQFIFYFWSFEIRRNILRNQKTLSV